MFMKSPKQEGYDTYLGALFMGMQRREITLNA